MSAEPREPGRDELLAMAYVDGELAAGERRAFEERLEREPALNREVAALQRLSVLARQSAPPEPTDREWHRIAASPAARLGLPLALALIGAGAAGLSGWCLYEVCRAPVGIAPKLLTCALAAGFLILFLLALRARARTRPLDPYTDVKR